MGSLIVALTLGVLGSQGALANQKQTQVQTFSLSFVSNRQFEIEPCGCSMGPLGGFSREFNLRKQWAKQDADNYWVSITAGNTFTPIPSLKRPKVALPNRKRALGYAKLLAKAGTHVLAPSISDLSIGVETLKEIEKSTPIRLVSTNLSWKKDGKPLFSPYISFEREGRTLVLLSIVDPAKANSVSPQIIVNDVENSIKSTLKSLPSDALVVLVSTLSPVRTRALQKRFTAISVAFNTEQEEGAGDIEQRTGTQLYLGANNQGQSVNRVDFRWQGSLVAFYNELFAKAYAESSEQWLKSILRINRKIASTKKMVTKASLQKKRQELVKNLQNAKTIPKVWSPVLTPFQSYVEVLDERFEGPSPMTQLIREYRKIQ